MYILRTDWPTDQRPIDLAFWKISNGLISETGRPMHFMFGSMVGFSRSADRMSVLPVGPNPRSRPLAVLYNFEWPYLGNGSSDLTHVRGVIRLVTRTWNHLPKRSPKAQSIGFKFGLFGSHMFDAVQFSRFIYCTTVLLALSSGKRLTRWHHFN